MLHDAIQWVQRFFAENHFASGGLLLGAMTWVVYALRRIPSVVVSFLRRKFLMHVEITNQDPAYFWLMAWIAAQPYCKKAKSLGVVSGFRGVGDDDEPIAINESRKDNKPEIFYVPAVGVHLLRRGWHWLLIQRTRDDKTLGGGGDTYKSLLARESLIITGSLWARKAIHAMLNEARDKAMPPDDDRVNVYANDDYGQLCHCGRVIGRSPESVILDDGLMQQLLDDVELFRSRKQWYIDRGVPWRRGYLLHGPPGNGKSSAVRAIASHFNLNLAVINLSGKHLTDRNLLSLMNRADERMALVIEDIDCLYEKREAKESGESLTFSGLLNAIDGVASGDGRILFMTTNRKEVLDRALIRPGRADVDMIIDNPTKDQARRLYRRFFPKATPEAIETFAGNADGTRSMAELQAIILRECSEQIEDLVPA